MKMGSPVPSWSCLAILAVGFFGALRGMDTKKVYELTEKEYYSEGWRVPVTGVIEPDWQKDLYIQMFATDPKSSDISALIQKIGNSINLPVLFAGSTSRTSDAKYTYPIEETIRFPSENTQVFEALLNAGVPVNGYPDLSILKYILLELTQQRPSTPKKILVKFVEILIRKGVNLDEPFPDHNGFGPDTTPCKNCTARKFLEQTQNNWNQDDLTQVKSMFDTVPVKASAASHSKKPVTAQFPSTPPLIAQTQTPVVNIATTSPSSSVSSSTLPSTGLSSSLPTASTVSSLQPTPVQAGIFQLTGKRYDEIGWNTNYNTSLFEIYGKEVNGKIEMDINNDYPVYGLGLWTIFASGNGYHTKNLLTLNSALWPLDTPSVILAPTAHTKEVSYLYPLQFAIQIEAPVSTLRALLELGSPTAFKGYDPFKHILDQLNAISDTPATGSKIRISDYEISRWIDYIKILIEFGANPNAPSLGNSTDLQTIGCHQNEPALSCINALIAYYTQLEAQADSYLKPSLQKKLTALHKINQVFTHYRPPVPQAPTSPVTSSPSTTSAPAITAPLRPQAPTVTGTGNQPNIPPASSGLSDWCKKTTSVFAQKTICAFVVGSAAVVVAAKLAYNRWWTSQPAPDISGPLTITCSNKTGDALTLTFKDSTQRLDPLASVTLDEQDITQIKISSEQLGTHSVPVNVDWYKEHRKSNTLNLTIQKTSALIRWWTGNPYSYTATWQPSP